MKLLLASKSSARRAMLAAAGVPFDLCESGADEDAAKAELTSAGVGARAMAGSLAGVKASGVQARSDALVLGADQTLERDDGTMLHKAASRAEAADQLRSLRGRTHFLHSAAAVAEEGAVVWSATETVALRMRAFSDAFLAHYLDAEYESVRFNVGAYAVEGAGLQLFDGIEGSTFAVLGLPLLPLLRYLRTRGVIES